jgi:hypothetical protein
MSVHQLVGFYPSLLMKCFWLLDDNFVTFDLLRHGSNELDTFMLVLSKHCQARSDLIESCLKLGFLQEGHLSV